jgi:hypothetical protein
MPVRDETNGINDFPFGANGLPEVHFSNASVGFMIDSY